MSKKLYVGNLSFQATEQDLEKLFSPYGQIVKVDIVRDRYSGQSKGFGFVEMADGAAADKAIEQDGQLFMDRTIRVNEARPPQNDFRKKGGGGGPHGGGARHDRGERGGGGGGWGRR